MFARLFNNMKIATRMGLAFSLLLGLMLTLIVIGIVNLAATQTELNTIVHDNLVKIDLSHEMRFLARHEAVLIRNILLLRDAAQKEKEVARRKEAQKSYQGAEDKLIGLTRDDKSKAVLTKILDGKNTTRPLWDWVVQLGLANKSDEGIRLLVNEVRQVQWKWLDSLDELVREQNAISAQAADRAARAYQRALMTLILLGLAAFGLAVVIAVLITRSIVRPLRALTWNMARLTEGDLTLTIDDDRQD